MKPLNEIRFWLCAASFIVLLKTDGKFIPTGWWGLGCLVILIGVAIWAGFHLTDLLIAFKKWWRE